MTLTIWYAADASQKLSGINTKATIKVADLEEALTVVAKFKDVSTWDLQ